MFALIPLFSNSTEVAVRSSGGKASKRSAATSFVVSESVYIYMVSATIQSSRLQTFETRVDVNGSV